MSRIKLYTVGRLADLSGVSVRSLHHYDEIGLLVPPLRGAGGRRLYDRDSAVRLQQILTYRTLGLALDDIRKVLDDPNFDRRSALLAQREAIEQQITRNQALLRGIDEALALLEQPTTRNTDMATLFGGFDPEDFADEAKTRWGRTQAWKSSNRRTAAYTEEDWARYHKAHQEICRDFARFRNAGVAVADSQARANVRRYAALIDTWFYPCNPAHLDQLAEMYEADARFRETFDAYGLGTSDFVIAAFKAFVQNPD